MKITIRTPRPRNPLVVPMRARSAGRHERSASGRRRDAEQALRRELDRLKPSP
jgi:hypothetical protein